MGSSTSCCQSSSQDRHKIPKRAPPKRHSTVLENTLTNSYKLTPKISYTSVTSCLDYLEEVLSCQAEWATQLLEAFYLHSNKGNAHKYALEIELIENVTYN